MVNGSWLKVFKHLPGIYVTTDACLAPEFLIVVLINLALKVNASHRYGIEIYPVVLLKELTHIVNLREFLTVGPLADINGTRENIWLVAA